MQIVLDGNTCDAEAASVGEAIAAGADEASRAGRRIVEVYVDGSRLTDDDITSAESLERSADEVRLVSADPALIVRETLLEAKQALDAIGTLQETAAELIQTQNLAAALPHLSEAFELWLMVQDATVMGADFAGINLGDFNVNGVSLTEIVARLNALLKQAALALRGRDEVALSDTLLYEMPAATEEWKQVALAIANEVSADRA